MFRTMKQLFAPTNKDLRIRILFTLGALAIFIIGTYIPIPGVQALKQDDNLGFLEMLNTMSGGALKQFSIFALGVMPYITASIIIQLLQMDIFPYFSELKDQGPVGRQKLNQITRYMGIIFAFFEGFAFSYAFMNSIKGGHAPISDLIYVATIMTAGTAFLLWLGDQVTQKGIGNGISLIIMAGIIAQLPHMFELAYSQLIVENILNVSSWVGILLFALLVIVYFLIIIGVIFVELAERKIPIQYANKSTSVYSNQSFMPIKVDTAGVIPVIFASTLLAIPATIAGFLAKSGKTGFQDFVNNYLTYTKPVGFLIFVALIFFFAYFYTFIQLKPEDLAKNLKENGGFIPGVRPGKDTENYISKVLSKLTIIGGVFLVIIAGLPIIFSSFSKLDTKITIGGTSLLIVVGVALETYKQLEGSLVSRNYKKGYSRR